VYSFIKRFVFHASPAHVAQSVMTHDYTCRTPVKCDALVADFFAKEMNR
jgi:hypothetical protein